MSENRNYVKNVYRENRTSKKGNSYQVVVIEFDNGYKLEEFMTNEMMFILGHIPCIN